MPKRFTSTLEPPVSTPPLGEPPEPPIPHLHLEGLLGRATKLRGRPGGLHLRDFRPPASKHGPAGAVTRAPITRQLQQRQAQRAATPAQPSSSVAGEAVKGAASAGAERAVKTAKLRHQEQRQEAVKEQAQAAQQPQHVAPAPSPAAQPAATPQPRRKGQLLGQPYNATAHPERSTREQKHGTFLNPKDASYRGEEPLAERAARQQAKPAKPRPERNPPMKPPAGMPKPEPAAEQKVAPPAPGQLRGSTAKTPPEGPRRAPVTEELRGRRAGPLIAFHRWLASGGRFGSREMGEFTAAAGPGQSKRETKRLRETSQRLQREAAADVAKREAEREARARGQATDVSAEELARRRAEKRSQRH